MGWRRILPAVGRYVGRRAGNGIGSHCNGSTIYSWSTRRGKFVWHSNDTSVTMDDIRNPFYYYRQQLGISTTRRFQSEMSSESNTQPVPSPLTQLPALPSARTEDESSAPRKRTVQAVLKRIKQSPKKVNLVAALVRGMRVEDALLQMSVTVKRAAKTVYKVIHSARANATHNHGLDADRLIVAEAFVGKGLFRKTLSYHAKGRSGIRVRPQCRLTVVLRELTPEEEAEIARLRVRKFRKLSRRERQLVPHKLIETKWQWHRKQKENAVPGATMA